MDENHEADEAGYGLLVEAGTDDAEIDVVAVHGIGGDRRKAWTFEEEPDGCWLQEAFSDSRVLLYGYDTKFESGSCFTERGIVREAKRLLESLRSLREGNAMAQRPIMFVSHGIGGLLVKAALVFAARSPSNFGWLCPAVRVLIFFGYPHEPLSLNSLRDELLQHMLQFDGRAVLGGQLFPLVQSLCETIDEVNSLFIQAKILLQTSVVNVVPIACEPVFEESSTILRVPYSYRVESKKPHATMTRLDWSETRSFERMKDVDWVAKVPDGDHGQTLRSLISQASPIYPLTGVRSLDTMPALDEFLTTEGNMVLHVQSDDDAVTLSERLCVYLQNLGTSNPVYFQFDPHDIRFSTISSMLRTSISQLSTHHMGDNGAASLHRTLDYLQTMPARTPKDLIYFWERCLKGARFADTPVVCVLGGLDRCVDSSTEFISHLGICLREQESYPKMIVTTTLGANESIRSDLLKLPGAAYREHTVVERSLLGRIKQEASFGLCMLPERHLRCSSDEALAAPVSALLEACSGDETLLQIIRQWVTGDRRPTCDLKTDLVWLVDHPAPESVFGAVLGSIVSQRQGWARTVLNWILLCFRPLTTEELCLVSYMTGHTGELESLQDILGRFGGLLRMEHGEIRFGHPRVRPWLESNPSDSGSRSWWQLESRSQGHFDILMTCLEHLVTMDEQPTMSEWPTADRFQYAVQHWPGHYRDAQGVGTMPFAQARDRVERLFEDEHLRRRWLEAYLSIADPFTTPGPVVNQALPLVAHLGLEDLVELFINDAEEEEITLAIVEAAKQGHLFVVRRLLSRRTTLFRLEDPRLGMLLRAATSCGVREVLQEVMKLIRRHTLAPTTRPAWLSDMLLIACWIDNEDLMVTLLDLGADPSVTFTEDDPVGLTGLAACRNATSIIKVLLDRGIDIKTVLVEQPSLVSIIAEWSSSETIRLLYANGMTPGAVDQGWTALQAAAALGRYQVVETLLELESLKDCINDSSNYPLLHAAWKGFVRTTEVLMKGGADLSVSFANGNALHCAVDGGSLRICETLIKEGIDVNLISEAKGAPLIVAVTSRRCKLEIVRLLLDHGANIETREPKRWKRTPLLIASAMRTDVMFEVVRLLLERNADVTARDSEGWTPLYTAADFGLLGTVQLLVDANSDLTAACDTSKETPLHAAIRSLEITRVLLDHGVDPSKKYEAAESPLEAAVRANQVEVVKLMVERSLENAQVLSSSLLLAVQFGYEKVVRILLDAEADVNHTEDTKRSLLGLALSGSSEDIVRMLLEFRPDLNSRDVNDNSILHHVTISTPVSSMKLVVNAGAKLDAKNKWKNTPLTEAVDARNWDVMRYLLSKKATLLTLNIAGIFGAPLHRACRVGAANHVDIIKLLVENGADVELDCGRLIGTPIMQACLRFGDNYSVEKESVIRYLVEERNVNVKGRANTTAPIHLASMACHPDIIALFLQKGADVAATDDMNRRVTHLACYNSLAAVEVLDVPDDDFAAKDAFGRSPLHYAVASGQLDLLEHVLDRTQAVGLGVDAPDNDGWTPLLWAARATNVLEWDDDDRDLHASEIVQFLLDHGADPRTRGRVPHYVSHVEWSASDIARYHGASDLAAMLAKNEDDPQREKRIGLCKVGEWHSGFCDGCYLCMRGIFYECKQCDDFWLCFKCYSSRERVHPAHDFKPLGSEKDVTEHNGETLSAADEQSSAANSRSGSDTYLQNFDDEVVSDDESVEVEEEESERDENQEENG